MEINLLLAVTGIIIAMLIVVLSSLRSHKVHGVDTFCQASILAMLGIVAFMLIGQAPRFITQAFSNIALITASMLMYVGVLKFLNRPIYWTCVWLFAIAYSLAIIWFVFVDANAVGRLLIGSTIAGVIFSLIGVAILRSAMDWRMTSAAWFTVIASFFVGGLHFLRSGLVVFGVDEPNSFNDPTFWNLALSVARTIEIPSVTLGMILLVQERIMTSMHYALTYDDLTGVFSRRSFLDYCEKIFSEVKTDSQSPETLNAILFLDLDRFKAINDEYGHSGGDAALTHFCDVVRELLRPGDQFGRMGGEEFAILRQNVTLAEAEALAEQICQTVRRSQLVLNGNVITLTISIGVAVCARGESLASAMSRADAALYQAKFSGRDKYCFSKEAAVGEEEDRRSLTYSSPYGMRSFDAPIRPTSHPKGRAPKPKVQGVKKVSEESERSLRAGEAS